MLQIDLEESDLYTPMNWRQIAATVTGVGLLACVLVILSSGGFQTDEASVLMAKSLLFCMKCCLLCLFRAEKNSAYCPRI